jgi:hypothetical protein
VSCSTGSPLCTNDAPAPPGTPCASGNSRCNGLGACGTSYCSSGCVDEYDGTCYFGGWAEACGSGGYTCTNCYSIGMCYCVNEVCKPATGGEICQIQ